MAKPHNPKKLVELLDELAPALRRLQGGGTDSASRLTALTHLGKNGPATMREIADVLRITPQAATGLIDGLENDGLVGRERHPTDRRKTVIRATKSAAQNAKAARAARADDLVALFDGIPKEDRAAFARVSQSLLDRLR